MEVDLRNLPHNLNEFDLTREIASVVHSEDFHPRKADERELNFHAKLNYTGHGPQHDGAGTVTFPTQDWGLKFLRWIRSHPLRIGGKIINAIQSTHKPDPPLVESLLRTSYQNPDLLERHHNILTKLEVPLRVNAVQFGTYHRERYPSDRTQPLGPRSFSVEWERSYENESAAWLRVRYEPKCIVIELGSVVTERTGQEISIFFSNIQRIGVGSHPELYICFNTVDPPLYEAKEFYTNTRKQRLCYLNPRQKQVAPFAKDIRIVLRSEGHEADAIEKFAKLCQIAGLPPTMVARSRNGMDILASKLDFYHPNTLYHLARGFSAFTWPVAFQLEILLRNGYLNPRELRELLPAIRDLCVKHPEDDYGHAANILRWYGDALPTRPLRESPLQCFARIQETSVATAPVEDLSRGYFLCCHITFTPTRMILAGPYPTQSNRVIREYTTVTERPTASNPNGTSQRMREYECNFIRVDFRDEDRLQYQWKETRDDTIVFEERVRRILEEGFKLAGKEFKFLAHSTTLRGHSVWFMHPFKHAQLGYITPNDIRNSRGLRHDTQSTSKYVAGLDLAFTATEPSVRIHKSQWEEAEDSQAASHQPTDVVGGISQALSNRIWDELRRSSSRYRAYFVQPSVYQIRFLGYQGLVAVDKILDENSNGAEMRLRRNMRKFVAEVVDELPLEIVHAFGSPESCKLNRSLIMLLGDRGVHKNTLLDLQNDVVSETRSIDQSSENFQRVLDSHGLGGTFRISHILSRLKMDFNLDIRPEYPAEINIDNPFFRQLRHAAFTSVMQDVKQKAKIGVPESYLLAGVVDEGPAYEKLGHKGLHFLPEGHIYACIQTAADEEPIWLDGICIISRGQVFHPGHVQRARAIGRPPEGKPCFFSHLKNCVVLSSLGDHPLTTLLRDGANDNELFSVISYAPLLPSMMAAPPEFETPEALTLDRDVTVHDICDFVVDHIKSDVFDLLLDKLLITADQSEEGMYDPYCLELAKLCDKALSYPRNGIRVDLNTVELPPLHLQSKPDWHSADDGQNHEANHYVSPHALGHLYRAIKIDPRKASNPAHEQGNDTDSESNHRNPISVAIWNMIQEHVDSEAIHSLAPEARTLFTRYAQELQYISGTHTVSNAPKSRLEETEVALGTILSYCAQARWKEDITERLNLHSSILVSQIRAAMVDFTALVDEGLEEDEENNQQILVGGLQLAWAGWRYSVEHGKEFGAKTFGLIALGVILDCLDKLDWTHVNESDEHEDGYENVDELEEEGSWEYIPEKGKRR